MEAPEAPPPLLAAALQAAKAGPLRYEQVRALMSLAPGNLTPRPYAITDRSGGLLFWEEPGHAKRLRRKRGDTAMDTWKNSGGKNPVLTLRADNGEGPIIERRAGRVMQKGQDNAMRYHQYALPMSATSNVEAARSPPEKGGKKPRRDMWEHRSHLFHVLPQPTSTPPRLQTMDPLQIEFDVSNRSASEIPPLVTLAHRSLEPGSPGKPRCPVKFINFKDGEANSVGDIEMTEHGLKLTSSSGDFAEWHELECPVEQIDAEDVVYITSSGKATRSFSSNCKMAGIVSGRAVVAGSRPMDGTQAGVEVAYCGRVPVRCLGPVAEGDVLVASGASDGLARASSNCRNQGNAGDLDCRVLPREPAQGELVVGVAMTRLATTGIGSVEVVVTPPSLTTTGGLSSAWWLSPGRRTGRQLVASVIAVLVGLFLATISVYIAIQVVLQRQAGGQQATQPCEDDPNGKEFCQKWAANGECFGDRGDLVRKHCPRSCKLCDHSSTPNDGDAAATFVRPPLPSPPLPPAPSPNDAPQAD